MPLSPISGQSIGENQLTTKTCEISTPALPKQPDIAPAHHKNKLLVPTLDLTEIINKGYDPENDFYLDEELDGDPQPFDPEIQLPKLPLNPDDSL